MQALKETAKKIQNTCVKHRRYLHAHAEVGFETPQTQAYIVDTLTALGYTPKRIGKAGVVAEIGKGKETLLLRADADALPIREKTGLPFASKNGNMHACGHDMHVAMLLGTAEILKRYENELSCKTKLLFQSAEELLQGAKDCVEHGATENVDGAMTLHVLTGLPLASGTFIVSEGISAPSADYFTVTVKGKACHGGAPQNGVDALTIGARILLALEEIVAREIPQTARAVLTVGKLNGGVAGNAIAETCTLEGTLRCFGEETRSFIKRRIQETAKGIAKAFRSQAKCAFQGGCPALINDRDRVEFTQKAIGQVFDENKVLSASQLQGASEKSGGSEDFAYIARETPAVALGLCAGETDKGYRYPLHHPKVIFDENVLWKGALAFAVCALTK